MIPPSEIGEDAGLHSLARPGSVLERTARGAGWIIFWRFANRALGLISTLILVRLLSPSDFGIVALAMSFVQGLTQFTELGTDAAIIRADMPDRALYDTGFTINVLRGLLVAAIILLIAAPAARFFHSPHFTAVVMVAAGVSVLGGFENIGVVDFRRFIAFEKEFRLKLIPRLISVATAVLLAFALRDFWALIIAIVVNESVTVWLTYAMHPYRPRFTLSAWHRIASYSTLLWMANIVSVLQGVMTNTVIGRLANIGAVGVYGVGAEIAALPSSELSGPLSRAAFSGFAELRKTEDGGAAMLVRMVGIMLLITLPAGTGLSLVADPLVRLAFGTRWLSAVPVLQVLGIAQALTIFGLASEAVFAVHAWLKALLKLSITLTLIQFVLLIVLVPRYGLPGAAIAGAISVTLSQIVYFAVIVRRLNIGIGAIVRQCWRSVVAAAIMVAILVALGLGWSAAPNAAGIRLVEASGLGAVIYVAALLGLWILAGRPDGPERDLLKQLQRIRPLPGSP